MHLERLPQKFPLVEMTSISYHRLIAHSAATAKENPSKQ
jgi:hypothetical protein